MKKAILMWLIIVFLSFYGDPESSELSIPDVGKVHWGMSRDQVKETEKQTAVSKDNYIYYQETLLEYPVLLYYHFKNDRLIDAFYVFSQKYSLEEYDEFIKAFNKVKKWVIEKYGEPTKDTHFWKRGRYLENAPVSHKVALWTGEMTYIATWENERTFTKLLLRAKYLILSFIANKEVVEKF